MSRKQKQVYSFTDHRGQHYLDVRRITAIGHIRRGPLVEGVHYFRIHLQGTTIPMEYDDGEAACKVQQEVLRAWATPYECMNFRLAKVAPKPDPIPTVRARRPLVPTGGIEFEECKKEEVSHE